MVRPASDLSHVQYSTYGVLYVQYSVLLGALPSLVWHAPLRVLIRPGSPWASPYLRGGWLLSLGLGLRRESNFEKVRWALWVELGHEMGI